MSVYVFDSEDKTLSRHADPAAALRGRDVSMLREQRWLFFTGTGESLRADVLADGSSQLRPWASCSSCTLVQVLPFVASLDGSAAELAALRERLNAACGENPST